MKYLKFFESDSKERILIIVDVQKSFEKFFNKKYLSALNKYCDEFQKVYQIFDNHHDGNSPDIDFQYHENPDIENKNDLYKFNNEIDLIEKRYTYGVNIDYFKKILSKETYNDIKSKEKNLKQGEYFPTTEGTIIVYIGNNHKYFHLPVKLYNLFKNIKGEHVVIVGGADNECIEDIIISAKCLGLTIHRNDKYIYSANNCPIS